MSNKDADILEVLNPADSFTLAMDEEIRQDGLSGSYGCFALELNHPPDQSILQQRIDELADCFPVILASLQQHGRRFYWCKRNTPAQLFFQHQCPDDQDQQLFQQQTIDQIINYKQAREEITAIEFHLLIGSTKNTFFIRWIHPLCDARGADLIVKFLCTADPEKRKQLGQPKTKPLVNIQLDKYRWWQKITLFLKGKRYVESLDKLQSIQPFDETLKAQKLNYSIYRLTEKQTGEILQQARQSVGLTGTSLYYIGCLMRALEKMKPNNAGEAYCVPYAFNLRKQQALTPITGNHVCALFAQAARDIVSNREQLFKHLKNQNTKVIRQQQDYAFLPLMWAGSWLSLQEYGKVLRLSSSKKERSSFWFSDIGKLDIPADSFPGAEIKHVFHVCQVTTPPGLAFLSCIYQNQLTLSYNFVEPLSNKAEIEQLHTLMLNELLASSA